MAKTAGDILVEILIAWGVDTEFGIPGDGINGIMEALRTRRRKFGSFRCGIEGLEVNAKRVYRLYDNENLKVRSVECRKPPSI